MGHSDIIFDNTYNMIKELIEYHNFRGRGNYYLCELDDTVNLLVEIFKNIKFDPGCLDKIWIHNCMTVGLSSSFLEPLEATSIGTTINQMFLFLNYIQVYIFYFI